MLLGSASLLGPAYVQLLAIVLFAIQTLRDFFRGKAPKLLVGEALLLAFVLWGVATLLSGFTLDPAAASLELLGAFAAFVLLRRSGGSTRLHWGLALCFLAGGLVAASGVIWNWISGHDFQYSGRFTFGGFNANYVAYCLATAIGVCAVSFLSREGEAKLLRIVRLPLILLLLWAVLLTGSRGALASAVLSLTLAITLASGVRVFQLGTLAALCIGLILYAPAMLPNGIAERFELKSDASKDWAGRDDLWALGWEAAQTSPIHGSGYMSFPVVTGASIHAHNLVLALLVETGAIGFLLFTSALLTMAWPGRVKSPERWAGLVLLASFLPIAMTGVWVTAVPAWLMFGWANAVRSDRATSG